MEYLFQNYSRADISFVKGSGSYLYDASGGEYLDFGCGIAVTNLGHVHAHVTKCLKEQMDTLWHTSNLYRNSLQEDLARRIAEASFGGKAFFCNSGAEANETALKLARIYSNKKHGGKKPRIITMNNSFHGRTFATLAATAQAKVQAGFEPIADYFTYLDINDLPALEKELAKGDVGAVMLELLQGESGVRPAEDAYVGALCKAARAAGALVIFDEIQTGYGRTGKLFAWQHTGEAPDIMTIAKSIANGFPMGAVEAVPEVAELFAPGAHGATFGGNYLACAAAHAVLDVMLADGFLDDVQRKGRLMKSELKKAFEGQDVEVRGRGMMVGVRMPMPSGDFVAAALKKKLVAIPGGAEAVRFYPPLTATDDEIREGVARAASAYKELMGV